MDQNQTEHKCDAATNKQCMCNGCAECQNNAKEYHKKMGHNGDEMQNEMY